MATVEDEELVESEGGSSCHVYTLAPPKDEGPLDRNADTDNNVSMSKSKPKPTLTDTLKAAIEQSGLTRYRIAKETGIPESHLGRFVRREMSLRLDRADKLAAYLGLRLTPDPDAKPPEPTPENLARPMLMKHRTRRKAK